RLSTETALAQQEKNCPASQSRLPRERTIEPGVVFHDSVGPPKMLSVAKLVLSGSVAGRRALKQHQARPGLVASRTRVLRSLVLRAPICSILRPLPDIRWRFSLAVPFPAGLAAGLPSLYVFAMTHKQLFYLGVAFASARTVWRYLD